MNAGYDAAQERRVSRFVLWFASVSFGSSFAGALHPHLPWVPRLLLLSLAAVSAVWALVALAVAWEDS